MSASLAARAAPTVEELLEARDTDASLATHAKTFRWAAALLGVDAARRTRSFYALCRLADDLGDEVGGEAARFALDGIDADLARGRSTTPAVQAFLESASETEADLRPTRILLRAVASDTEPCRLETVDELVRYAYAVASTVGLTMCDLFGVDDDRARPFAIDLGVGMQLTNIARDVLEDAELGRLYLPAELLGRRLTAPEVVRDVGDARARCLVAVRRTLALADRYYASADRGMAFLPLRARAAVLTASRCYQAIGRVILDRGPDYWRARCYVGAAGKTWHTLRAFGSLLLDPRTWPLGRRAIHDAELHRALLGLPGADGGAS